MNPHSVDWTNGNTANNWFRGTTHAVSCASTAPHPREPDLGPSDGSCKSSPDSMRGERIPNACLIDEIAECYFPVERGCRVKWAESPFPRRSSLVSHLECPSWGWGTCWCALYAVGLRSSGTGASPVPRAERPDLIKQFHPGVDSKINTDQGSHVLFHERIAILALLLFNHVVIQSIQIFKYACDNKSMQPVAVNMKLSYLSHLSPQHNTITQLALNSHTRKSSAAFPLRRLQVCYRSLNVLVANIPVFLSGFLCVTYSRSSRYISCCSYIQLGDRWRFVHLGYLSRTIYFSHTFSVR